MKLKYLLSSLAICTVAFTACEQSMPGGLDEVEITPSTYVSIPEAGGSATITVDAAGDWYIYGVGGDTKTDDFALPSWFTVSPTSGGKGETVVTFTAGKTAGYNAFDLKLIVGERTQYISVRQGVDVASEATCKEVLSGPDGKTYLLTGVCTRIANDYYGNWYIKDDSSDDEVYIYGTVDATGSYNWSSFGIEVGDVVTIKGPKTTYNDVVELVDVKVINVEKALLSIEEGAEVTVPAKGGEFSVSMTLKGNGPAVEIPDEAKGWITIKGIEVKAGVPDPAFPTAEVPDTTVVTFVATENAEEAARKASISFTSSTYVEKEIKNEEGEKEKVKVLTSTVGYCNVTQNGLSGTATRPFSVAEAIEFALATTAATTDDYYVKGKFVKWNKAADAFGANTYGNASFWISEDGKEYLTAEGKNDTSKMFEAYQVVWLGDKSWATGDGTLGAGDEVVICGPLTKYNTTAETAGKGAAYVYSVNGSTEWYDGVSSSAPLTVAQAITKAQTLDSGKNTTEWYFVQGKFLRWHKNSASNAFSSTYGNGTFWMSDDGVEYNDITKEFEAYRVLWFGNEKWADGNHTLAAGDVVVLHCQLKNYNGTSENQAGYVFSVNGKRSESDWAE